MKIHTHLMPSFKPVLRFASALLVICIAAAGLVPGLTVYAASYDLWVGGTRVTSDNAGSLLGGKASYNASTNTLTLNGASITSGVNVYDSDASAAIYSADDLNIVLKGNSTVSLMGYAAAVDGDLSISGSGTLTATTTGDMFSCIFSGGKTSITGGTITLRASGTESIGMWASGGLTLSSGTLTASGTGACSFGILCDSALTVTGGTLTASASGAESWGIAADGKLSVTGGTLRSTATGTNATGILAASLELSNGSFEASGTECAVFLDGASGITVGSGYTLYEGTASPGSPVNTFSNSSATTGMFMSKCYLNAKDTTEVIRLGGGSRYETATIIASHGWTSADTVVLVNAFSYADALAGVPLANALDAPILLVNGTTIDDIVLRQISALGAKNAYLLGGELAISAAAAKQLSDSGIKVTRISGQSRYGTAIAIAKELSRLNGTAITTAIFANGFNYPDALAVSSAAAITGTPILYAPATGKLDNATVEYLESINLSKAVVLGGELAIDAGVYSSIQSYADSAERISGGSRYETAVRIIEKYSSVFTGRGIAVATGTNYPDALAGAAFAASEGIAVMLVPSSLKSGSDQTTMLKALITNGTSPIYVFGGQGAVSDDVISELLK